MGENERTEEEHGRRPQGSKRASELESHQNAREKRARQIPQSRSHQRGFDAGEPAPSDGNPGRDEDDEGQDEPRRLAEGAEERHETSEGENEASAQEGSRSTATAVYFVARIMMCHPNGLRMASGRTSKNGTRT